MDTCPICGHKVDAYHELRQKEPYTHTSPFDGIHIYGAYSAPKETLCFQDNFLHFAFFDAEDNLVNHSLVKLGVENPSTKSPSDEFWESCFDEEEEDDEWEEVTDSGESYDDEDVDDLPF